MVCVSICFEDMAFSCDDSFEFGLPPIPSNPEQTFSPSVNIVIANLLVVSNFLDGRQILYNFLVSKCLCRHNSPDNSTHCQLKNNHSKRKSRISSCTLLIHPNIL